MGFDVRLGGMNGFVHGGSLVQGVWSVGGSSYENRVFRGEETSVVVQVAPKGRQAGGSG